MTPPTRPLSFPLPPPSPDTISTSSSDLSYGTDTDSDLDSDLSISTASSADAPPLFLPSNPSAAPMVLKPRVRHAPRRYQLDLLARAQRSNVIACLHTGAGKTLIAALLINSFLEQPTAPAKQQLAHDVTVPDITQSVTSPQNTQNHPQHLRAVFLVPRVPLVSQQAAALRDVLPPTTRIATYIGARVDTWDAARWAQRLQDKHVIVSTPQILLNLLRHGLISLTILSVIVVDEAHHATKKHPYTCIFREFYHTIKDPSNRPRVFAMTATPVKTKADASGLFACDTAITALEHTLDARLVAVSEDDRAELEAVVPRPDEFVVFYDDTRATDVESTHLNTEPSVESECTPQLPTSRESALPESPQADVEPDFAPHQEEIPVLSVLTSCGSSATQPVVSDSAIPTEHDLSVLSGLHLRLGLVPALLFSVQLCNHRKLPLTPTQNWILTRCTSNDGAQSGLRDKTAKLLDLLFSEHSRSQSATSTESAEETTRGESGGGGNDESYEIPERAPTDDAFRAIVFVQERATALALAATISTAFQHCPAKTLRAQAMLGCSSSEARVTQAEQRRVVAAFRNGLFGILVATSVGEEGLDIPSCRLVVSFDVPASATTYVQARGRARRRDARFVALLNSNHGYDFHAFREARLGANVMAAAVSPSVRAGFPQTPPTSVYLGDDNEPLLRSRSTSARVRAPEAVALLYQVVAHWTESGKVPSYKVGKEYEGFTSEVTLPALFGEVVGRCDVPQPSAAVARRRAALHAYEQLYNSEWVDEHLLPKRRKRVRDRKVLILGEGSRESRSRKRKAPEPIPKAAKKHTRVRDCSIEHPLTLVQGNPDDESRKDRESVANSTDGAEVAEKHSIPSAAICDDGTAAGTFEEAQKAPAESGGEIQMYLYVVKVDHDLSRIPWASHEHTPLGLAVRKQLYHEDLVSVACPVGEPLLTLIPAGNVRWTKDQETKAGLYARAVQMCHLGKTIGTAVADKVFEEEFSSNESLGFYLVPIVEVPAAMSSYVIDWFSIEKLLMFGWLCGPLEVGDTISPTNMVYHYICSSHERNERAYISSGIEEDVLAGSTPSGSLSKYSSYVSYFETKFNSHINPEQAMMCVQSVRDAMHKGMGSNYRLPSQLVRVIPIPVMACYVLRLLPDWQTFMAFRSCWRRNRVIDDPSTFLLFTRALQPNVNCVVKGNRGLNYERLEFLGDAALKVVYSMLTYLESPEEGEGVLSDTRDLVVSNQTLASIAMKMRIQDCIAFSGMSKQMKKWPWHWSTQKQKGIGLSEKVLADCVEALIGVQYEQGGIPQATIFMDRHNVLEDSTQLLNVKSIAWLTKPGSLKIASPSVGNDTRLASENVGRVESIIGYEFRDKRHLVTALTHGSVAYGKYNYQRYEYLGDAIIGFLILSHFYYQYPDLTPGHLTFLRGPALSNDLFARGIVNHGIHRLFWYDSAMLQSEIERFERLLASEGADEDVSKQMAVPKVLGDLLESIIGAVVVDKGMQLEGVLEIGLRLVGKELNRFANPERFVRDAIAELHETLQKLKIGDQELVFDGDGGHGGATRCTIRAGGTMIGVGQGSNRRIARRMASRNGLERIRDGMLGELVGEGDVSGLFREQRLGCAGRKA